VKPLAVLDSSTIVSAIGWQGEARRILSLLAKRAFTSCTTPALSQEWAESVAMTAALPKWRNPNWANWLRWLADVSLLVEAAPLRRTVKRDPKDDPVLAAALGARAGYVVSYDRDLLDLEKPFGVQCIHPRAFLIMLVSTMA
jgi:uncharacterized protein